MLVVNEIIERQERIDMLKSAHIYELGDTHECSAKIHRQKLVKY